MGLTEGQQDAVVLEHSLMVAQQRDATARSRAMMARIETPRRRWRTPTLKG